jgi:lipoprotein-releasing system permease protein
VNGSSFFIAFRYLLGRAREGGRYLRGASAGIAVSLIPIVVTLIVADGMIQGITDRYLELGTGHIQIYNFVGQRPLEDIKETVLDQEHVRGAWIERQGMGVIVGKKGKAGAVIRAIENDFWKDAGVTRFLEVIDGENRLESDNEAFLGEALADAIGAKAGDIVRLMTVRLTEDGKNLPMMTPFTIKAVISAGYREIDSLWFIIGAEAGKRVFSSGFSNTSLIIKIDAPYKEAGNFAENLYSILEHGYGIYTWKELQIAQYSSYESTRQVLLFIMALIVIVAAVTVSSATSMLVIERRRDIAVLKASGAAPAFISRIFIYGAFIAGLIGAGAGIGAGLAIGLSINHIIAGIEIIINFFSGNSRNGNFKLLDPAYYLENFPIVIDWTAVLIIGVFTVLCSVVASYLPAKRAGKLKPLEILRKL